MGNLNVAVLGKNGYASQIGKKGTVTDMTFFEVKRGADSVTLVEPSKYPDKLSSLFYSVGMAEFAILVVDRIDASLGETIVMADTVGLGRGWIVLQNFVQPEQLRPLLAGTSLEGYGLVDDDPVRMREELLDMACAEARRAGDGTCGSCPVDSHFNVKGVGTVVLGSVIHGHFRKHDKMTVLPPRKEVVLKSIQKHDLDADDAVRGDHVGLALRGIDSEELDRGYVITTDPSVRMSGGIEGRAALVKYWPSALKEGMVLHVGHWMQMVPARITRVVNGSDFRAPEISMDLESDIIHRPGDTAVIMYLEGGKLRVVGRITLA